MTISGIHNSNSLDQQQQGIEQVHEKGAVDLVIPEGDAPIPKNDDTKTNNPMKGAFCQSYFEKSALQTVFYGLGLYALWSNKNLLDDGISALRKGADSITAQTNVIGLQDQQLGGQFVRDQFFKQTIEENNEQKSFYDELFNATQDSTQDDNLFSSMETEAVQQLVEQSFYDKLMLSDLQMATDLENKLNTWILEQKNLDALREIDELKDDVDWLENEVKSLNEDIQLYQQKIQELTQQGIETRSKFTEALNQFDQFHRRIERVCDVLLKIPIVKRIGAVKGFCKASDDVREILDSSRNYLQQTGRRRLEDSQEADTKYTDHWPPLLDKSESLHNLKLLTQLLEAPALFPLTDAELNDFDRLKNVTSVLSNNKQQASDESTAYFQQLQSHLNNFTKTALKNYTSFLNSNSTSDEDLEAKLNELLELQSQVHADVEPVLKNIDKVEKKWGNAGVYLALAATALVYMGMTIAHCSRLCRADRQMPRALNNPLFNPQNRFTMMLGRGFQKVLSYNMVYRQEALKKSMAEKEDDDDIEAQRRSLMGEDDGGDSEKLKKLSLKTKGLIFGKHCIEGAMETLFSAGFLFVVAGRILDNILQENREDIKTTTNNTNSQLQNNGTKAIELIGEIRDIAIRKRQETNDLKNQMSQAHTKIKNFNDQTLPDEIRRYNQELLSDPSNNFSPEFEEMMTMPEFSNLIVTAYKPDDEFTNTLNAFEKFINKLSTGSNTTQANNSAQYPANFTDIDAFEQMESHYLNSNRAIDEPSLPNQHSFGIGNDIAVVATVLAIRIIGGYVMETRDLNKSLDKDMVSTRQRPFEWLTSWFTEQKPFVNGVTDVGLLGKFLGRKYGISDPFAIFQNTHNAYKKDDGDSQTSIEEL